MNKFLNLSGEYENSLIRYIDYAVRKRVMSFLDRFPHWYAETIEYSYQIEEILLKELAGE